MGKVKDVRDLLNDDKVLRTGRKGDYYSIEEFAKISWEFRKERGLVCEAGKYKETFEGWTRSIKRTFSTLNEGIVREVRSSVFLFRRSTFANKKEGYFAIEVWLDAGIMIDKIKEKQNP